jgi:very-short-patch-repair endonuclease
MSSDLEETFALQVRALKLSEPVREYQFMPGRKFRFDFAWPELMLAVELDGGTWSGGRHTTGQGFQGDCRKLNLAVSLGWQVYRGDSVMVKSGELVGFIEQIIGRAITARAITGGGNDII